MRIWTSFSPFFYETCKDIPKNKRAKTASRKLAAMGFNCALKRKWPSCLFWVLFSLGTPRPSFKGKLFLETRVLAGHPVFLTPFFVFWWGFVILFGLFVAIFVRDRKARTRRRRRRRRRRRGGGGGGKRGTRRLWQITIATRWRRKKVKKKEKEATKLFERTKMKTEKAKKGLRYSSFFALFPFFFFVLFFSCLLAYLPSLLSLPFSCCSSGGGCQGSYIKVPPKHWFGRENAIHCFCLSWSSKDNNKTQEKQKQGKG